MATHSCSSTCSADGAFVTILLSVGTNSLTCRATSHPGCELYPAVDPAYCPMTATQARCTRGAARRRRAAPSSCRTGTAWRAARAWCCASSATCSRTPSSSAQARSTCPSDVSHGPRADRRDAIAAKLSDAEPPARCCGCRSVVDWPLHAQLKLETFDRLLQPVLASVMLNLLVLQHGHCKLWSRLTNVWCATGDGREYTSRVQTRHGYATVRVPFNSFRSVEPGAPPLDPADAARLSVRYEPRSRVAATIIGQEDSAPQCAGSGQICRRFWSSSEMAHPPADVRAQCDNSMLLTINTLRNKGMNGAFSLLGTRHADVFWTCALRHRLPADRCKHTSVFLRLTGADEWSQERLQAGDRLDQGAAAGRGDGHRPHLLRRRHLHRRRAREGRAGQTVRSHCTASSHSTITAGLAEKTCVPVTARLPAFGPPSRAHGRTARFALEERYV